MSTITYAGNAGIGSHAKAADAAPVAPRKSFWGRIFDAVAAAQQRRAEREIIAYLRNHGDLLNDETEREIMERLSGRRRSF
jgi:hypothetical protein